MDMIQKLIDDSEDLIVDMTEKKASKDEIESVVNYSKALIELKKCEKYIDDLKATYQYKSSTVEEGKKYKVGKIYLLDYRLESNDHCHKSTYTRAYEDPEQAFDALREAMQSGSHSDKPDDVKWKFLFDHPYGSSIEIEGNGNFVYYSDEDGYNEPSDTRPCTCRIKLTEVYFWPKHENWA